MDTVIHVLLLNLAITLSLLILALVFGGPKKITPLASLNTPFKSVDLSDLPQLQRYTARDKTELAYRIYTGRLPQHPGSLVLIHGSSANGKSLHPMAVELAKAGYTCYTLDIRGHGESGRKGTIAYIGQLEDDLEDFLQAIQPQAPRTLAGFSAGGGFALRFAADRRQRAFDRYLLLAPFIHHNAPTKQPAHGGVVSIGLPRSIALVILNKLGITVFNQLPTSAFALTPEAQALLTPSYSYNLMQNFRPNDNYQADIRAAGQAIKVLVGADDEAFRAGEFAGIFAKAGRGVPVTLVANTNHIGLTLQAQGISAIVSALDAWLPASPDGMTIDTGADVVVSPA